MMRRAPAAALLVALAFHQVAPAAASVTAAHGGHADHGSREDRGSHADRGHEDHDSGGTHHPGCPWKRPAGPCPHEAGGGAAIEACADPAVAAPAAGTAPVFLATFAEAPRPAAVSAGFVAPAAAPPAASRTAPDTPPPRPVPVN